MSVASLLFSLLLFESRLICLRSLSSAAGDTPPPSAMAISAPRARDDGGLPPHFDGSSPPHGRGRNVFPPCPHCSKKKHPANKCYKQFGKPPTAQMVLTPLVPFPQCRPTSLLPNIMWLWRWPSMMPFAIPWVLMPPLLLASHRFRLPPRQVHMLYLLPLHHHGLSTRGLPLIWPGLHRSYCYITYPLPSPPLPLPMPGLVWSKAVVLLVSPLLFLFTKSSMFLVYLSTFSLLVLSLFLSMFLVYTVTFFPFHCIFQDLYIGWRIGLGRENGRGIYELVADEPSLGLQALFVTSTATSSLFWHRRLGHQCFDKLKKTLPWLSLTEFVYESC